jgi:magnesium chelatase subunit I
MARAETLGQLRTSGYPDRTVKEEVRANLLARLSSGAGLFPSIIGYEDSVLPTLERAVLAGHDIIMLGERGQAKSRLMRYLVELLDEEIPAVQGCEVNDHPYHPICARCRQMAADLGDELPVAWIGREVRYSEKLATPDIAVADLIGDVDPIRVAEGRYLGDELTIHYGLVPRTHRGIFAINELPDLPERIQVSLLNILEERDIQVRGYKIRLPLDLMLIASANPEDYTHRGRIITPLKDRFGTQVRTHYPNRVDDEIRIMEQEAAPWVEEPSDWVGAAEGIPVLVPRYLKEVIAECSAQLRTSPQVNQRSGVSVRFSIGGLETLAASALRRAVKNGEQEAVPRPVDLWSVLPAAIGRVEFDTLEEGREPEVLERGLRKALMDVGGRLLGGENFSGLLRRFEGGLVIETSDAMSTREFLEQFDRGDVGKLTGRLAARLGESHPGPAMQASMIEFALEGLHLGRRINKDSTGAAGRWRFEYG